LAGDARVVFLDLLCLGKFRIQGIEQHRRHHAADRVVRRTIQESAAVDRAMHVLIKQLHHFGVEIARRFSLHGKSPLRK